MTRSAATLICGPRTKYVVLAFWVRSSPAP